MTKVTNWYGHRIRWVYYNSDWYAVLADVCDAVKLKRKDVRERIDPDFLAKTTVPTFTELRGDNTDPSSSLNGKRHYQEALIVSEPGIYQALFASRKLEAQKFRKWTAHMLCELRKGIKLETYEAFRMTEPEYQHLAELYLRGDFWWDDDLGMFLTSKMDHHGDPTPLPFYEADYERFEKLTGESIKAIITM